MTPAWWSVADAAEQDLLIHELVDGYYEHVGPCDDRPCRHVGEAIQAVLDWRRGRQLRSRAAYLRAEQDALDLRFSDHRLSDGDREVAA